MIVRVIVPRSLAEFADGQRQIDVDVADGACLGGVLSMVAERYPALGRRIVDETGALRRHVNVYVGLDECRRLGGLDVKVPEGVEISVLGSIAGG